MRASSLTLVSRSSVSAVCMCIRVFVNVDLQCFSPYVHQINPPEKQKREGGNQIAVCMELTCVSLVKINLIERREIQTIFDNKK